MCSLQEVASIRPHSCMLFSYYGSTCRAIKSRDERPSAITGCNVLTLVGISRGHYVGLDRLLDILGTLHHLPQLLQQLCCNFWTHLPTCNCLCSSPRPDASCLCSHKIPFSSLLGFHKLHCACRRPARRPPPRRQRPRGPPLTSRRTSRGSRRREAGGARSGMRTGSGTARRAPAGPAPGTAHRHPAAAALPGVAVRLSPAGGRPPRPPGCAVLPPRRPPARCSARSPLGERGQGSAGRGLRLPGETMLCSPCRIFAEKIHFLETGQNPAMLILKHMSGHFKSTATLARRSRRSFADGELCS